MKSISKENRFALAIVLLLSLPICLWLAWQTYDFVRFLLHADEQFNVDKGGLLIGETSGVQSIGIHDIHQYRFMAKQGERLKIYLETTTNVSLDIVVVMTSDLHDVGRASNVTRGGTITLRVKIIETGYHYLYVSADGETSYQIWLSCDSPEGC